MKMIKSVVPMLIMVFVIVICWTLILQLRDTTTPSKDTTLRSDPIFGVTINGDGPQRVHIYESGDDIRPDLYEVYYFPEIIINNTQGHYEVYRTMGKDR